MNIESARTLFDYNYWARDRVLLAASEMPSAEYSRSNGFTYGSIRGILAHCLEAERGWRCRLQDDADTPPIAEADTATVGALAERWREEEAQMRAYLDGLTDADLARDVVWRGRDGSERRFPDRWLTLAHVVMHSTQHRSEAAEALTMAGHSPGDLDLGLYARERLGR